jgi:predicted DNA-binding transcriptional regulator AlpA
MGMRGRATAPKTPIGKQEIAALLGYPRNTVYQWKKRKQLPPRDGRLSGQDWWWSETIIRWAVRTGRDGGLTTRRAE